jgi:hypothetical protein
VVVIADWRKWSTALWTNAWPVLLFVGVVTGLAFGVDKTVGVFFHPKVTECTVGYVPDRNPPTPTTPASLTLRAGQDATLHFGRGQMSAPLELQLDVAASPVPADDLTASSVLNVTPRPFRKEGTATEISTTTAGAEPAKVTAAAFFAGDTLTVRWCANRSPDADPGTYHGALVVSDPRVHPLTIPVSLTLSYNDTPLVSSLLPLVGAVGLLMTWNIRASRHPADPVITKPFYRWLWTIEGLGALVAGGAAMLGVFWATYMNAQVWGSNSWDVVALGGALYAAFVGAAATVNVLSVPAGKSAANQGSGELQQAGAQR